jgi:hypothetical protein
MADPIIYVNTPPRQARRGGVRSVANFVHENRLMAASTITYTPEGCTLPQLAPGLCWGETIVGDKVFEDYTPWMQNPIQNFAGYAGVECFLNGGGDFESNARSLLEQGEDRLIEQMIQAWTVALPIIATDELADVIALAEQEADNDYVARPILIMSRANAVRAASQMLIFGDTNGNLVTANGTPVLASGFVDDGTVTITGQITVFFSDIVAARVQHWSENREMALAERGYGITVDCGFARRYTIGVGP